MSRTKSNSQHKPMPPQNGANDTLTNQQQELPIEENSTVSVADQSEILEESVDLISSMKDVIEEQKEIILVQGETIRKQGVKIENLSVQIQTTQELGKKVDELASTFAGNSGPVDHMQGNVRIILYNGMNPRTLEYNNEKYNPEYLRNNGNTPVYTLPTLYAQTLLTLKKDRYALYWPENLLCKENSLDGGRRVVNIEAAKWDDTLKRWDGERLSYPEKRNRG